MKRSGAAAPEDRHDNGEDPEVAGSGLGAGGRQPSLVRRYEGDDDGRYDCGGAEYASAREPLLVAAVAPAIGVIRRRRWRTPATTDAAPRSKPKVGTDSITSRPSRPRTIDVMAAGIEPLLLVDQAVEPLVKAQQSGTTTEIDTAGDGFFATFDGPTRAVRCAMHIANAVQALGMEVRAGIHTGECQTIDGKVGGLGVVIGARVGSKANAGEVLVSQTVKDLTAGSGLSLEDAGMHELKGIPEHWHLYRVA
jgi:class 3 adenylate cyclase